MSVSIILQNLAQLKALFGKATINTNTYGKSTGRSSNYSTNYQISGRELITADEVGRLKRSECVLMITGERPFKSKKYDISKHKRYKELHDTKAGRFDLVSIYEGEAKIFFHDVKDLETFDASELNEL